VSEELVMLQEYFQSLGLDEENLTEADLKLLSNELKEAGEMALANFVNQLDGPEELLNYIGE